jgi:hypothetical protein
MVIETILRRSALTLRAWVGTNPCLSQIRSIQHHLLGIAPSPASCLERWARRALGFTRGAIPLNRQPRIQTARAWRVGTRDNHDLFRTQEGRWKNRLAPVGALNLAFPLIVASVSYACAADTVVLGTVGAASANLWPVLIGLNKGMFAENDIKVDLVHMQSSAAIVAQLTAGSLDVTMSTGLVDPIRAVEKGSPVAIVRFESQLPPTRWSRNRISRACAISRVS